MSLSRTRQPTLQDRHSLRECNIFPLSPVAVLRPVKGKAFPGLNPRNRFAISGDKASTGITSELVPILSPVLAFVRKQRGIGI